jgi:hypothetical protein
MNQDWSIQSRSERCSITGEPFQEGEYFYTLLFYEKEELRRQDLSEGAWKARDSSREPFSFWRSKFEPPPPPSPEPLAKQTAEDLLRQYMQEGDSQHASARYILALMLERKRLLKQVENRKSDEGERILIYEHVKTGEVFVVPDPGLHLDQIEKVQMEVSALLMPAP